jgi:hypothetical protein
MWKPLREFNRRQQLPTVKLPSEQERRNSNPITNAKSLTKNAVAPTPTPHLHPSPGARPPPTATTDPTPRSQTDPRTTNKKRAACDEKHHTPPVFEKLTKLPLRPCLNEGRQPDDSRLRRSGRRRHCRHCHLRSRRTKPRHQD